MIRFRSTAICSMGLERISFSRYPSGPGEEFLVLLSASATSVILICSSRSQRTSVTLRAAIVQSLSVRSKMGLQALTKSSAVKPSLRDKLLYEAAPFRIFSATFLGHVPIGL